MSIEPERQSCRHVRCRYRFDCSFSVTLPRGIRPAAAALAPGTLPASLGGGAGSGGGGGAGGGGQSGGRGLHPSTFQLNLEPLLTQSTPYTTPNTPPDLLNTPETPPKQHINNPYMHPLFHRKRSS
jgi:hypothetical protein